MTKPAHLLRGAATALLLSIATGAATAVTITTGSYANLGMGAEFASPFDNLYIDGRSIDVAAGGAPVALALADYAFEVGPNCYACSLTPSFDAVLDVTVDGLTRRLDLAYAWSSNGPTDRLVFATPAPIRFDFADSRSMLLTVADLGVLSSTGETVRGQINAVLSVTAVPEPPPWALAAAGLGLVAWMRRRRGRRR